MAFERCDGSALQLCECTGDESNQGYQDRFRETTFRNRSGKQSSGCVATRSVDVRFLGNANGIGKGFGLSSPWRDRCAKFSPKSLRQLHAGCTKLYLGLNHLAYWLARVSAAIKCALILECAGRARGPQRGSPAGVAAQRRRRFGSWAAVVSEPRAVATGSFSICHLVFFICHCWELLPTVQNAIDSSVCHKWNNFKWQN